MTVEAGVASPWAAWAVGLVALLVGATLLWIVSVRRRDASIVDPFWGPAFLVACLAWTATLPDGPGPRGWLTLGLVAVWAIRLGVHLGVRARGAGEDPRYAAMRESGGPRWWLRSLVTVFWLQATLAAVIGAPLFVAIRSDGPLGFLDGVAVAVFVIGFAFEAIADAQLAAFRSDPDRRGTVLDTGLWRWSRHPNYFGDALLWWGLGLLGVSAGSGWTLLGPAIMTWLLMRISGVPLLESRLRETRPGYAEYVRRTSAFVPWVPKSEAE